MNFVILLALCAVAFAYTPYPFWKVFCDQTPIYRGRADPIVDPAKISTHVHRVFGGSNFGLGDSSRSPIDEFNLMRQSPCTTCSITADKTAYWVPDLYYKWPDGTFSLVPTAGLTVYYPARTGTGNQSSPAWRAFPPGFRMISGDAARRSFNATSIRDQAISYACLGTNPSPETHEFPKDVSSCINGMRAQVWFPMCWDGVNLDSPDHKSHVSHPIERPDNGNCPPTHPVRLPGVFYEVMFSVTGFPRQANYNPFVWSCGDSTGYGYHGDFLNGWDPVVVQAALQDPTCDANNTNNGNNVKACKSLAPYVVDVGQDRCLLNKPIPNIEDLGYNHRITALPGCNPITNGPDPAQPCDIITPQNSSGPGWQRFLLQPKNSKLYVGAKDIYVNLTASATSPFYSEVWTRTSFRNGWTIQSDLSGQFVTSPHGDALRADKNSADTWEIFIFNQEANGYFSINSLSNNLFVSIWPDGTLHSDSKTVGDAQLWSLVDPSKFTSVLKQGKHHHK